MLIVAFICIILNVSLWFGFTTSVIGKSISSKKMIEAEILVVINMQLPKMPRK